MLPKDELVGGLRNQKKLENTIATIVKQIDLANDKVATTLEKLATELDKKQRDMNIAKTAFASSGILGTGLAIGGFIAAFFTFGVSLGLTVAGVAVGVTSGLGGLATAIADKIVNGRTMKEAEAAIATYMERVNDLLDIITDILGEDIDAAHEMGSESTSNDINNLEIFLRGLRTGVDAGRFAFTIATRVTRDRNWDEAHPNRRGSAGRGDAASRSTRHDHKQHQDTQEDAF